MFEFLKGKKNNFVGIDFGTSSIKVVEISYNDQKINLENYGVIDLNPIEHEGKGSHNTGLYNQKITEALKQLVSRMALKQGSQAYVAIPGFSGLITIIELQDMPQDELAKAIQFEAHKYIPTSLDEVAMSWEVINYIDPPQTLHDNIGKEGGKRVKILLVAAPKKDIEHYEKLVSETKFSVKAIELETFSIARSLVGEDMGAFFIIDIGWRATNMILVEKGIVRVNRNIDAGGNEITSAIAESMGISKKRAESFKLGDKDLLNGAGGALMVPVLELIVGESKRILSNYKEKNKDIKVDAIFLSGGTAEMKGLSEYFSRCLNEKVVIGNPWSRINNDNPDVKNLMKKLGTTFSVALGLALRGVEDQNQK